MYVCLHGKNTYYSSVTFLLASRLETTDNIDFCWGSALSHCGIVYMNETYECERLLCAKLTLRSESHDFSFFHVFARE